MFIHIAAVMAKFYQMCGYTKEPNHAFQAAAGEGCFSTKIIVHKRTELNKTFEKINHQQIIFGCPLNLGC